MNKRLISTWMIAILIISNTAYGAVAENKLANTQNLTKENSNKQETKVTATQEVTEKTVKPEEIKGEAITLDEAISYGLSNSLLLKQIQNQEDIAKVVADNGIDVSNTLNNGQDDLDYAGYLIQDGRDKVYQGQIDLKSAQAAVDNGLALKDIEIPLGNGASLSFKAGEHIESVAKGQLEKLGMPGSMAAQKAQETANQVLAQEQVQVDTSASSLSSSQKQLEASTQEYLSSQAKYDAALQFAIANVANKLSVSTISSLRSQSLGELIIKMTSIQEQVTAYSVNIYKNQIALGIENSYFEALKQQKLLEVKDLAKQRALVQYELAKAAYEVGAKSKDDMLYAKSYYDSAVMNRELQVKDYSAALIGLKKNMNIDLSKDIQLVEVEANTAEDYDLAKGITSGLSYGLNIKMAEAQSDLYDALMKAVDASNYSSSDNQHKEVVLLQQKAKLALDSAKLQTEGDIRTSYATMMSMQKIVNTAKELEESAKENAEIAKVKYEVGFGYDNALLKQLNLQDMSGTVVEVIAAEENLVNIQEKQIEAINGYNLARLKYQNDIGVLPYK